MRELEFLPTWYPQAHPTTLAAIAGLHHRDPAVRRCSSGSDWRGETSTSPKRGLATVDAQLAQSLLELEQLQVQLKLKSQLEFQRQIVSRLGLQVEVSRMINTLEHVMPKEMSLCELSFDTDEEIKKVDGIAAKDGSKNRVLRVKLLLSRQATSIWPTSSRA